MKTITTIIALILALNIIMLFTGLKQSDYKHTISTTTPYGQTKLPPQNQCYI